MILGITGSIGSGKTTAARLFGRHWYSRIDADEIGHEIMKKNSAAYKKIVQEFGNEILDKNRNIDRKKLGDMAFSDTKSLKKLNSIMHPRIFNEIKNKIKKIKAKCKNKTKIIIDAPLLLETKAKDLVGKVIVVKCDIRKIFVRNKNFSRHKIEKILKAQMPLNKKLEYADFVIDNNKSLRHLKNQVEKIVEALNKE